MWVQLKGERVGNRANKGRAGQQFFGSVKIDKKVKETKNKKWARCGQIIGLASWEMERDREQKVGDGM